MLVPNFMKTNQLKVYKNKNRIVCAKIDPEYSENVQTHKIIRSAL
jgi:hypothetical protein